MRASGTIAAKICAGLLVCCTCVVSIGISRPARAQDPAVQADHATKAQSAAPIAIHEVLILPPEVTLFTEPEENLLARESAEREQIVQRNATTALKEALIKWGIPETSSLRISDRADEAAICRRDNLLEIARWRFRPAPPERLKDCPSLENRPDAYLATSIHGMEDQRSRALGKMGEFLGYTVITLFLYPAISSYPVLSDTRRGVVMDTFLVEPGSERVIVAGNVVNAGDASVLYFFASSIASLITTFGGISVN